MFFLLRLTTQWTPGRIDFRGTPMTTERSAYGTVFSFPEIGFIGTGHFENEPEDLQAVRFILNDKAVANPTEAMQGESFRFERESRIRQFALKNTIEIKLGRIYETSSIATDEAVALKLVYHFMHAWVPTMSEFVAGIDGVSPESPIAGKLPDDEEFRGIFYIRKHVDWLAVYEPHSQQFAMSRLLASPEGVKETSVLWNIPGTYRKYYLIAFQNQIVPAGFNGTWQMVSAFGKAAPEEWAHQAELLAKTIASAKLNDSYDPHASAFAEDDWECNEV